MAGGFFSSLFSDDKKQEAATPEEHSAHDAGGFQEKSERIEYKPDENFDGAATRRMMENLSPTLKTRHDRLSKIRNNLVSFEESMKAAKSFSSESTESVVSLRSMLRDAELDLDRQVHIEQENVELRERVSQLETELAITTNNWETEKAHAEASKARVAETRDALQQAKSNIVQHLAIQKELQENLEAIQLENEVFEANQKEDRDTINRLQQENVRLSDSVTRLRVELAEMQEAVSASEKEAAEWKRVHDNTNKQRETLQRDLEDVKNKLLVTNREKIDLSSRLEIAINDLALQAKHMNNQIRSKDDRIYSLEAKNETLESKIRIATQQNDILKNENADLLKVSAAIEDQIGSVKATVSKIRKGHESDRNALYKANDRIAELDIRIKETIAKLEQTEAEKQAYADIVDNLSKVNNELSEKLVELTGVEERYTQLLKANLRNTTVETSEASEDGEDHDSVVIKMVAKNAAE